MSSHTPQWLCAAFLWLLMATAAHGQPVPVLANPSACGLGLPLRDETCRQNGTVFLPDRFDIVVADAPGTALGTDVYLQEVQIIVAHTWVSDLGLSLRSPSGVIVPLMLNNGDGNDNLGDPTDTLCQTVTRFAVGACTPVEAGSPPFTAGPYQPVGDLYAFNDGTNPNGTWQLLICDYLPNDVGTLEYIRLVFAPATCLPITTATIQAIDGNAVTVGWAPAAFCGTVVVEYGPPGFTPGTGFTPGPLGTVVLASCHPVNIPDLLPETAYELYVRRYCEATTTFAPNTCPTAFTTGCQPPPVTVLENFDEQVICPPLCTAPCPMNGEWQNLPGNPFNWIVYSGPTPTAGTGPSADVSGIGRYVYLETSGGACPTGSTAYLYSPCFLLDKQGTDTCHVSFHYHLFGNTMGTLRLEASTDGGLTWQSLWQTGGNQGDVWRKAYVGLGSFQEGTLMQLRFAGTRGSGLRGNMALDVIAIHGSQSLGFPDTKYYVDNDGDGFGQTSQFILSCLPAPPTGYAALPGDCNDNNPDINPGAPEIPCDGIDNNCNGSGDDTILPPPTAVGDTVCSGAQATVCAVPTDSSHLILWYNAPGSAVIVAVGECFTPVLPPNNSQVPATYQFYASQTKDFACFTPDGEWAVATVIVQPNPAPSVSAPPAICPGDTLDLASVEIADANFLGGEVLFFNALPPIPANALPSTLVHPAATRPYYYQVATAANCTVVDSFLLTVRDRPAVAFSPADSFSLCRESTTAVSATPSGGAGGYTYLWSTGSSQSGINVSANFVSGSRDVYRLTVTDALGCSRLDSVVVTTISNIDSVRRDIVNVTACMGNDGAIRLVPLNGLPPFSYQWTGSNGQSGMGAGVPDTILLTGLMQGSYRVTITDDSPSQCRFVMRNILVQGPDAVINEPQITPVSCANAADGAICLSIQGGGNGSTFLWSTGDTTACVAQLPGGTYRVTVTTGTCAAVLGDLVVTEPPLLFIRPTLIAPRCHNTSDGAIQVGTFGGTPPYQYQWAHGPTAQNLSNLPAGTYALTVTDASQCTVSDSIVLPGPPPLVVQTVERQDISCTGQTDGLLWVTGAGGRPPYQYRWANGAQTPLLTGLAPGNYTVSVTDFNNCQTVVTLAVTEPLPLTVEVTGVALPLCVGDLTGEVSVAAVGGTGPFTFLWEDGVMGDTRNQLGVGTISVVAEDANGCRSVPLLVTLGSATLLSLSANISAPACQGPATGSIALMPQGEGPFAFAWATGDTTATVSGLVAATYTVTITDGRGCVYDTALVVAAPQVIGATVAFSQPNCHNVADGVANVVVQQSGTPPLTFAWQDGFLGQNRAGLGQGTYRVTVTDANGCALALPPFTLHNPPPLRLQVEEVGPISCFGQTDSYIELTTLGGTPPYTHNWVGLGQQTEDISGIGAGEYRLIVSDSRSCTIDTTFVVTQPPALTLLAQVVSGPVCSPTAQDTIVTQVAGGTPPYLYAWQTGQTTPHLANVPPGNYDVTVTDANGCLRTLLGIKVSNRVPPVQLTGFSVVPPACHGGSNGSMTATISGGSGQYQYFFSPFAEVLTGDTSVTVGGLQASATYRVTVTDLQTGCVVQSAPVTLPPLVPLVVNLQGIRPVSCAGGDDGAIFTHAYGGVPPYTYEWLDGAGALVSTMPAPDSLTGGTYTLLLTDTNGCPYTLGPVTVPDQNPPIVAGPAIITPVACKGEATGRVQLMMSGGMPPYQYEWSLDSQTGVQLVNAPAGTYTATVTDALMCQVVLEGYEVTEPATVLSVTIDSLAVPRCHGGMDGYLAVTPTGGVLPYTYLWRREGMVLEATHGILAGIPAGLYQLALTDSAGCQRTYGYAVPSPAPLLLTLTQQADTVWATVAGGTGGHTYLWDNGDTTPYTVLRPNVLAYVVTVTDGNGCTTTGVWQVVGTSTGWEAGAAVRVYPNPARGQVWLSVQSPAIARGRVAVLDVHGRVQRLQPWPDAPTEAMPLHLDGLPPGTYLLLGLAADGRRLFLERVVVF